MEKSLDDAETRIQGMAGLFGRSSFALGTLAFSLVLWLGRDNWRSMAGGVGVIGNIRSVRFASWGNGGRR